MRSEGGGDNAERSTLFYTFFFLIVIAWMAKILPLNYSRKLDSLKL